MALKQIVNIIALVQITKRSVSCDYVVGAKHWNSNNTSGNLFVWDVLYDGAHLSSNLYANVHALVFDPFRRFLIAGGEFDLAYVDISSGSIANVRGLAVRSLHENEWRPLGNLEVNKKCNSHRNCAAIFALSIQSNESECRLYMGGSFQVSSYDNNVKSMNSNMTMNNVAKCVFHGNSWSWHGMGFSPGINGAVLVLKT